MKPKLRWHTRPLHRERVSVSPNLPRVVVLAQSDESEVTGMIAGRPLQELELPDEHGPEPAGAHLRLRNALPPSAAPCLRQVDERSLVGRERRELLEELRPEAGVNPLRVRAT